MALTLRNTKGSPLTHQELDDNFTHLSQSLESASLALSGSFPADRLILSADSASATAGGITTSNQLRTYDGNTSILIGGSSGNFGVSGLGMLIKEDEESKDHVILSDGSGSDLRLRAGGADEGNRSVIIQADQPGFSDDDIYIVAKFGGEKMGAEVYHSGSLVFFTDEISTDKSVYVSGSLSGSKDVYFPAIPNTITPNIVGFDSASGQLTYYTTASFGGTSIYETDNSLTSNRVLTADGNDLTFDLSTATFTITSDPAQRVIINGLPTNDSAQVLGIDSSGTLRAMNTSSIAGSSDYISIISYQTGSISFTGVGSAFDGRININELTASLVDNSQTSSFVTNDQTSSFVTNDETSSFLVPDDTGSFYYSSSIVGSTISFFQGDGTTETITVAGGGTIDGTGTARYITRWVDNDTITTSSIYEGTDGNVGIGSNNWSAYTPLYALHIKTGSDAQMLIESDDDLNIAGIKFKTEDTDSDIRIKGAIFFDNETNGGDAYGRGDLIFATNNGASNTNVTVDNWRLKIDTSEKSVAVSQSLAVGTDSFPSTLTVQGDISGSADAYLPGLPNTTTANIVGFDTTTGQLSYYDTGSFGGGSTDISALNLHTGSVNTFTGSIQTEVDSLTAATSSYLTGDDTGSFLYSGSFDSTTSNIRLYSIDQNYDLDLSGLAGGGSGLALTASDEGSVLSNNVTSLDFVGNGVVATNVGSAVTVTVTQVDTGSFVVNNQTSSMAVGEALNTTITIKNMSAGTIAKGTPCYITGSGTSGNVVGVFPADASDSTYMPAGVVAGEELTNTGDEGVGYINGWINGVDTSAFQSGDNIYVAVGGGYTNIKPTGDNLIQKLGNVEKVHASNGSGVIVGAGRANDLPNINPGHFWAGDNDWVPQAVTTSSLAGTLQTVTDNGNKTTNGIDIAELYISGSDNSSLVVDVKNLNLSSSFQIYNSGVVAAYGKGGNVTNVALGSSTTGTVGVNNTTLIGDQAGRENTGGISTIIGAYAGVSNTANAAVLLGYLAGRNNTGTETTLIGPRAGQNNSGGYTAFVGQNAGELNAGNENVGIGSYALRSGSGRWNTAIGSAAGNETGDLTGDKNTFLGYNASYGSNTSITNATAIGADVTLAQSNTVILGNNANVGIGTSTPGATLHTTGSISGSGNVYFDALPSTATANIVGFDTVTGQLSHFDTGSIASVRSATSASYAVTASYAISASYAATASYSDNTEVTYANNSIAEETKRAVHIAGTANAVFGTTAAVSPVMSILSGKTLGTDAFITATWIDNQNGGAQTRPIAIETISGSNQLVFTVDTMAANVPDAIMFQGVVLV